MASRRLPKITPQHLMSALEGPAREGYVILDCRFPFEYEGGHIQGAHNIYNKRLMSSFWRKERNECLQQRVRTVVLHCEYSKVRGPAMYRLLSELVREDTALGVRPILKVLHEGYQGFFEEVKKTGKTELLGGGKDYVKMLEPPPGLDTITLYDKLDMSVYQHNCDGVDEALEKQQQQADEDRDCSPPRAKKARTSEGTSRRTSSTSST